MNLLPLQARRAPRTRVVFVNREGREVLHSFGVPCTEQYVRAWASHSLEQSNLRIVAIVYAAPPEMARVEQVWQR